MSHVDSLTSGLQGIASALLVGSLLSLTGWTFTEACVVTTVLFTQAFLFKVVLWKHTWGLGVKCLVWAFYDFSPLDYVSPPLLGVGAFNSLVVLWKTAVCDCQALLYKVTTSHFDSVAAKHVSVLPVHCHPTPPSLTPTACLSNMSGIAVGVGALHRVHWPLYACISAWDFTNTVVHTVGRYKMVLTFYGGVFHEQTWLQKLTSTWICVFYLTKR